jgi:putative transposase
VKLVANIQLKPSPEQFQALKATLEACNAACNSVSKTAWEHQEFGQYRLQKACYRPIRERFALTAQAAIQCVKKTADAYKLDRKVKREFRIHSAQPYDNRILRFLPEDQVSIWTLLGRQKIPFLCGDLQRRYLSHRKGESDLMFVRGKFYLVVVCDFDDPDLIGATDVLGVDFGIVNIATDSDGETHTGERVEQQRRIHSNRRTRLQRRGTRAAKRKLRQISGRQARFQKNTNHIVSKIIVQKAKRTTRAVAIEDLGGIRERVTARRRQRARLSNWSFSQLRAFLSYKCVQEGIPLILVDPRNTSRQCPECGHTDKKNRPTQARFCCQSCGHSGPADAVAATNIRERGLAARAVVMRPMVAMGYHGSATNLG